MARRPSVFVRTLSMEEGRKLQRITRTSKDPVRLRRAIVVLMSDQGKAVRDITSLMQVDEDYVRDVIRASNEQGCAALDPQWSVGRSRTIGEAIRQRICLIARTAPPTGTLPRRHLVAGQAPRPPARPRHRRHDQPRDGAPCSARVRGLLADHDHLEDLDRPGLPGEDASDPGSLRSSARAWTRAAWMSSNHST